MDLLLAGIDFGRPSNQCRSKHSLLLVGIKKYLHYKQMQCSHGCMFRYCKVVSEISSHLFYVEGWGVGVSWKACLFFKERITIVQHSLACEVPLRCECSCMLRNQCCWEKAMVAIPRNWIGFMFNCKVKLKKMKQSFTTLQWKLGNSLSFLDFKFGKTALI